MFDLVDEERSHPRNLSDTALWGALGDISDIEARNKQLVTEIVRVAEERETWQRAGFSSLAQWFAQAFRCDYATAKHVTETALALRHLPALDEAMSIGDLTLDQTRAAVQFATPETDAEIARIAVGMAPREIARAARTISPPSVADDAALYRRRSLSLSWDEGHRELILHGRLPLEQGLAVEQAIRNAAKTQQADDKKTGEPTLDWQQYTADALVTLVTQTSSPSSTGSVSSGDALEGVV